MLMLLSVVFCIIRCVQLRLDKSQWRIFFFPSSINYLTYLYPEMSLTYRMLWALLSDKTFREFCCLFFSCLCRSWLSLCELWGWEGALAEPGNGLGWKGL